MEEPTAVCCYCDKELPESQGTYSIQYDESGAFFICNECAKHEDAVYARFLSGEPESKRFEEQYEDYEESDNEGDNPGIEG